MQDAAVAYQTKVDKAVLETDTQFEKLKKNCLDLAISSSNVMSALVPPQWHNPVAPIIHQLARASPTIKPAADAYQTKVETKQSSLDLNNNVMSALRDLCVAKAAIAIVPDYQVELLANNYTGEEFDLDRSRRARHMREVLKYIKSAQENAKVLYELKSAGLFRPKKLQLIKEANILVESIKRKPKEKCVGFLEEVQNLIKYAEEMNSDQELAKKYTDFFEQNEKDANELRERRIKFQSALAQSDQTTLTTNGIPPQVWFH
jgi:hypothetical protein